MRTSRIHLSVVLALVLGGRMEAQSLPDSGVYEIVSGIYSECCGFAGIPHSVELPSPLQTYLKLSVNRETGTANLAFLAYDLRTVSSVTPCPLPGATVEFSFSRGEVQNDRLVFFQDIGPFPQNLWDYEVAWGANAIQVSGHYQATNIRCFDVPTNFEHANVTAVRVPPPVITLLSVNPSGGAVLRVQGRAGWTVVMEASDDARTWTPMASRVMDFTRCPICPYADVEDAAGSDVRQRFYRAYQTP